MRNFRFLSPILFILLGAFIYHAATTAHTDWWGLTKADKRAEALKTDDTPVVVAAAPGLTSFASVVKKVSPSVVTIFTTKSIHQSVQHGTPMFNDPFFRHFFGDPDNGEGGGDPNSGNPALPRHLPDQVQTGLGSGVIITSDGYILTNNHVIEVADEIKVELSSSRRQYPAKLVGTDASTDVALIKIEATDLTPMVIADSDKAEVGDVVLAMGTPFKLAQTVTMGIISAKGRNGMGIEGPGGIEDFIQTDAAINPGNSGGPLVDIQGRMIGLNTAIFNGGGGGNIGIGFAVPSNLAHFVMQGLLKDGHVTRGYLGVKITDPSGDEAEVFKLPEITGALVEEVTPGTAADEAGIKNGDIILEFNGKKVSDRSALQLAVTETPPNTACTVKVWRDAKEKVLTVTIKQLPADAFASNNKENEDTEANAPVEPVARTLAEGVKIGDLSDDLRHQYNILPGIKGVVVVDVDPSSPIFKPGEPGLEAGDVITEIKGQPVSSVKEAVELVKDTKSKILLRVWNKGNLDKGSYRYFVLP